MKILSFLLLNLFLVSSVFSRTQREERLVALVQDHIDARETKAYFSSIYLVVTKGNRKKIDQREFQYNHCMELLLDEFLISYFDALDNPQGAPSARKEAFKAKVKPSLHLLLGLNAHISHDLPISMWNFSESHPECSAQQMEKDYFSLNQFFSEIIPILNLELKRTHKKMSFFKGNPIEDAATKIISQYVFYMRRDAWNDFSKLSLPKTKADGLKYFFASKINHLKEQSFTKN